ncbi:MAG: hypothetical protein Ct9H300mP11_18630 [Chloroflexota bacterium]|nr:MAG: hypothetical protein Ct9H300mP11_18630 [Chloroflexota bacterium]
MKARGVSHIAICVANLEKSLEFYRDILGLTVKMHTTQNMENRPGAESEEMYDHPRNHAPWLMFGLTTLFTQSPSWC